MLPCIKEGDAQRTICVTSLQTEDILRHIRDSFSANLPDVAWMDASTKASAEEKAKAISQMIGYPDIAADPAKLDKHYEKVSTHNTFTDH